MTPLATLRRGDQVEPCCGFRLVGLPTAPFCPPLLTPEQQLNCKQAGERPVTDCQLPCWPSGAKVSTASRRERNPVEEHPKVHKLPVPQMRRESMAFHSMRSLCVLDVFHRFVILPRFLHVLKAQQLSIYTFVLPCSYIHHDTMISSYEKWPAFVFSLTSSMRNH